MLLLLTSKASSAEQVQAAVDAVRVNHLKRCRIRQAQPFSPKVFNALVKVRGRALIRATYAVEPLDACLQQSVWNAASTALLAAAVNSRNQAPSGSRPGACALAHTQS